MQLNGRGRHLPRDRLLPRPQPQNWLPHQQPPPLLRVPQLAQWPFQLHDAAYHKRNTKIAFDPVNSSTTEEQTT